MIKALKKWFRSEEEPSGETPTQGRENGIAADYAEPGHADDYDEDTSFNWRSPDASSDIFDSPDTHRVRVLKSAPRRPANDDDNPGYDPYDTGRFDASSDG